MTTSRFILNLTQHEASAEQLIAGVLERTPEQTAKITDLLTFTGVPTRQEIENRAEKLASLAADWQHDICLKLADSYNQEYCRDGDFPISPSFFTDQCWSAMIGGAPWLMRPLEVELEKVGLNPVYSFSERVSFETTLINGSVKKVSVFKHVDFI